MDLPRPVNPKPDDFRVRVSLSQQAEGSLQLLALLELGDRIAGALVVRNHRDGRRAVRRAEISTRRKIDSERSDSGSATNTPTGPASVTMST